MLSSQTTDEIISKAIANLREALGGVISLQGVLQMKLTDLHAAIKSVGFHNKKTELVLLSLFCSSSDASPRQVGIMAKMLERDFASDVPSDIESLVSIPGVGPKMGYLCLNIAWRV